MSGNQMILLGGNPQQAPVDPYFYSVTSLLHGDGVNGGQNNTFLDSSSNNFTITRNGNTTQGSFSPFSQTGWSGYFDGSGDYCTLSSNASMDFGAGNFTIECFVNTGVFSISAGASRTIIGNSGNSYTMQLYIETGSGKVVFGNTGSTNLQGTGTVADNQWHHIVVVRSGTGSNQTALFIDGQRQAVGTNSQNYSSGTIYLGAFDTGNGFWNGYISNLRIVKGTAVYDPTATTLTVPTTPLTAVSNTALLTLQSNRFLDNSTNAYTVTKAGDTSIQPFSPFNPITPYSTSAVGGSGYFDGSGDYLTVADNAALDMGSSNFTIEGWYYPLGNASVSTAIFSKRANSGTIGGVLLYYGGTGLTPSLLVDIGGSWAINTASSVSFVANQWNHFAVVRNGSAFNLYINGVSGVSASNAGAIPDNASAFAIGAMGADGSGAISACYMSDFRVVKGTAVYTSAFTPPTAPLTAITNTSLLTNFTNGAIFGNAAVADYETVGNAQISTSVKKYGTGSMAFDGTGDYLDTPSNNAFTFGTGDFTIEFWLNTSSTGFNIMNPATATGTGYWGLLVQTSNLRWNSAYNVTNLWLVDATPILNGQWNHVAICRTAGVTKAFFNGTVVATNADTTNYSGVAAWRIGSGNVAALNGYIDDFRITKYARYQYNFTPPAAAFPNIGGTVTLTADPYFDYTTLLLPGNGTNGAQNNTFLDSSTNAFSITRNGNTTQGTFSPFSQTGWGNYFDGTGDYLTTNATQAIPATGDFTIEAWVYPTVSGPGRNIVSQGTSGASGRLQLNVHTDNTLQFAITSTLVYSTGTVTPNQWNYVAVTRTGSSVAFYINGSAAGTATLSGTVQNTTLAIGSEWSGDPYRWLGYISNVRISNVVRTITAAPTAPFTSDANTVVLTCQSNRFIDASSNAYTITRNGDVSVQAFSPFNPTAAWSAATYGGSGYFDGSGDYLTIGGNSNLAFGTGDFTIEFWAYINSFASAFQHLYDGRPATTDGSYPTIRLNSATLEYVVGGAVQITGSAVTGSTWNHFVVCRSGASTKMFLNGIQTGSTYADSNNYLNPASRPAIGGWGYNLSGGYSVSGYMGDVRSIKGTALYTANFTPPTAPLTAITNTQLLCNFTNAGIYDATSKNDLETVGNAQISTTQSKFGGSSMYFDGTGDWLAIPRNENLLLRNADFTVECWIYVPSPSDSPIFDTRTGFSGSTAGFTLTAYSSTVIRIFTTSALISATVSNYSSTWTHVAVVRFNGTTTLYVNGVSGGTTTSLGNLTDPDWIIGGGRYGGSTPVSLNGYIDDLRVTRGIARYTSNFIPPTTAFLTL